MRFQLTRRIAILSAASFVVPMPICVAQGNGSAKSPAFEVASVRQNMNSVPRWRMVSTPDGVSAVDVTLQYAIREAFGVYDNPRWSGGPSWINERRFDIKAKFDVTQYPNPSREQRHATLQQLLADRFKLVVHHETRELPVYTLVVGKDGPKFQESKPEDLLHSGLDGKVMCHFVGSGPGEVAFKGCSMQALASRLTSEHEIGRTVLDKTGLTGVYNLALEWTPANLSATSPTSSDSSFPSIFTALREQCGLNLESTRSPVDVIVIDHVEMPSEN